MGTVSVKSRTIASTGKRKIAKENNRQIILDAAKHIFASKGYGEATVRDIIRATPLAAGTFYNYFRSKEEIYQAIRDEAALVVRPRLQEARRHASSIEDFISRSFCIYFDFVAAEKQNFRFMRCGNEKMQMRLDTPEVIAGFDELHTDIQQAIAIGFFPAVDADYLMAAIVGVALEVSARMILRDPVDPKGAAAFASALFLSGLQALPRLATVVAP
jgi:AcrR family transcriptional regulator